MIIIPIHPAVVIFFLSKVNNQTLYFYSVSPRSVFTSISLTRRVFFVTIEHVMIELMEKKKQKQKNTKTKN